MNLYSELTEKVFLVRSPHWEKVLKQNRE